MTSTKPFRIKRNSYLSEQEEKFAEFCKLNNISFIKKPNSEGRGINDYELTFEPRFLDGTEKRVVAHCKKHNIGYKFAVDVDGYHHYEFDKMIEEVASAENSCNFPRSSFEYVPHIKHTYQSEIKFVESDADIEELHNSLNPKTVMPKKWYLKLLYYTYPPYFLKIRKKKKALKAREPEVLARIECIEAEKKVMRDMLVLAGIIAEDSKESDRQQTANVGQTLWQEAVARHIKEGKAVCADIDDELSDE